MASVLQVKRSSSNTDGSGLTLASGELAYSTRNVDCVAPMNYVPNINGGALWIGDNNGDKRLFDEFYSFIMRIVFFVVLSEQ